MSPGSFARMNGAPPENRRIRAAAATLRRCRAGISDFGNHDNLANNKISGTGYTAFYEPTASSLYTTIDTTGSARPTAVNSTK